MSTSFPCQLGRHERHGRRGHDVHGTGELLRCRLEQLDIRTDHLRGRGLHEHPTDEGIYRMQAELEAGHDAEVAASTADRPEQVRFVVGISPADRAVGRDDVGGDKAIDGESAAPHEASDAATGDETAEADRTRVAETQSETVGARRRRELDRGGAGLSPAGAGRRVDVDATAVVQVEDDPAVGATVSHHAVATATDRELDAAVEGVGDDAGDAIVVLHTDDGLRPPRDPAIELRARRLVASVAGQDDLSCLMKVLDRCHWLPSHRYPRPRRTALVSPTCTSNEHNGYRPTAPTDRRGRETSRSAATCSERALAREAVDDIAHPRRPEPLGERRRTSVARVLPRLTRSRTALGRCALEQHLDPALVVDERIEETQRLFRREPRAELTKRFSEARSGLLPRRRRRTGRLGSFAAGRTGRRAGPGAATGCVLTWIPLARLPSRLLFALRRSRCTGLRDPFLRLRHTEEPVDHLDVELGVAIARIDPKRVLVRLARLLELAHAEERVPALVVRDRAHARDALADADRVLVERRGMLTEDVQGVARVHVQLRQIGPLLQESAIAIERAGRIAGDIEAIGLAHGRPPARARDHPVEEERRKGARGERGDRPAAP